MVAAIKPYKPISRGSRNLARKKTNANLLTNVMPRRATFAKRTRPGELILTRLQQFHLLEELVLRGPDHLCPFFVQERVKVGGPHTGHPLGCSKDWMHEELVSVTRHNREHTQEQFVADKT